MDKSPQILIMSLYDVGEKRYFAPFDLDIIISLNIN